jgi:hypothetical protein
VELLFVLVGLEFVLLVATARKLEANRRLQNELRSCHADLAEAIAHIRSGDIAAARRLLVKWPDFKRLPRSRPSDGRRLH